MKIIRILAAAVDIQLSAGIEAYSHRNGKLIKTVSLRVTVFVKR